MTVLAEVCTPPQVRRVDRYQTILDYPLSKNRDDRRAQHKSSKQMFPPIRDGTVVEIPSTSPRKPKSSGAKTRPSTAMFFEAAKTFHANKGQNKELRQRLMESHMTFMNWKIPTSPSRAASVMSSRPGTSLKKLDEAKEAAKRSPYTKEEVPKVESEKLLSPTGRDGTSKNGKKAPELPEKEKAILNDWLQNATVTDKAVISDLIECADRLTLTSVTGRKFRPGPAAAIKLWLKNANDAEKQIAEKFLDELEMLEMLSGSKEIPQTSPRDGFGPLMDRAKSLGYRDGKTDNDIDVLFDCVSRELSVPVNKPFSSSPRYAPHFGPDRTPAALWHLDEKRDIRYSVLNNTSNFINPNRDRGSHFDIHPDWPSYYN